MKLVELLTKTVSSYLSCKAKIEKKTEDENLCYLKANKNQVL